MDQSQNNGQPTKKYTIHIYERASYSVTVDATSKDHAKKQAVFLYDMGQVGIVSADTEFEIEE